ncbi:MAG TPA: sigma-70 family RNA polymerase sigma factor [Planctomycetota bacterium]|nr:sigma-70 family RNA polymerase sigma factor [Planctomycetota bacterium]
MEPSSHREEVQRLFLRHSSLLRGFILGLLPNFDAADEVLQEVFLTVTNKAADFKLGTDFLAWARAIARMKVLEQCRKMKSPILTLGPEALEAVVATAPELDDTWELRRKALAGCMEQIAPRARELIELRYTSQLLPPEIAARLSWSVGAVHVALARARKFLRECAQRRLALSEA